VLRSLWYLVFRCVLQLTALCCRSNDFKELEIIVLRHELDILRRQTRRATVTTVDRLFLAAASRLLPKDRWRSFIVTPGTLLRWHRRFVARRWTYARPAGRPPMRREVRQVVLRLARENPRWGYQRIVGELKGLGRAVSATTVRTWLREAGLGPAGRRRGMTWREFVRTHRHSLLAVDFFTVETIWLQRLYVLFFIEVASRRVYLAGCTPNPSDLWVTQQARHLTWTLAERCGTRQVPDSGPGSASHRPFRRRVPERWDRDRSYAISTPQANGVAERFVRTVRSECLDWFLVLNQPHLDHVLRVFIDHYNGHRPHRALDLMPPQPKRCAAPGSAAYIARRDRLGGVIHEYGLAA
jgi:putative transposase